MLAATLFFAACQSLLSDPQTADATLPNTTTPSEMVGEWVNTYGSINETITAYKGTALRRNRPFSQQLKITPDGTNCELVLAATDDESGSTETAGTIRFDPGSSNSRGSFTFLALTGEFKDGGNNDEREATKEELRTSLTRKYQYRMDGNWLRIEPAGEPTDNSLSFRKNED